MDEWMMELLLNCSEYGDGLEELQPLASIIDGPMTMTCILLGVFGNLRACCFLSKAPLNRRLVASLTVLAICDTILLLVALGYYSIQSVLYLLDIRCTTDTLVAYLHVFISASNTGSVWLIVLITVQRFTAIRQPFHVLDGSKWPANGVTRTNITNKHHTPHRMNSVFTSMGSFYRVPVGLVILALLVNIPTYFEITLVQCWNLRTQELSKNMYPSFLRLNHYYQMIYRVGFKTLVQSMGPFALVLSLTIATQMLIHRMLSKRRQLIGVGHVPPAVTYDTAVTYVSVVIVGKFLVLRALPFILDVWETFFMESTWTPFFLLVIKISNLLIIVNSSTNCLVYLNGRRMVDKVIAFKSHVSECDEFEMTELSRFRDKVTSL